MKLEDHSVVDNVTELSIDQKRYILFNGVIYEATICEIRSKDSVIVSFTYLKKPFRVTVSIRSIYKQKPSK